CSRRPALCRRLVLGLLRARRPPVRGLIQARQPRVARLFPGKKRGNLLQAFQCFTLQRVLQKNFRLEDLIVQTEIFLQYSLHSKALESLQKIASLFPVDEGRTARVASLYQTANDE